MESRERRRYSNKVTALSLQKVDKMCRGCCPVAFTSCRWHQNGANRSSNGLGNSKVKMFLSSRRDDARRNEFYASIIKNVRNFSQILKAIHFQDNAVFYCTRYGVKVTVEDLKCVQANAFINSELFEEYELNKTDDDEIIKFKVNLSVILECLSIFGTSPGAVTTLKIFYQGYGFPLEILIEEDGVITNCTVKTLSPELLMDFNFGHDNVPNKVILRSDAMRDIMNDLDMTSEIVKIFLSPDAPYFRLTTVGDAGESQTDIPKDCDIVDSFQCTSVVQYSYKFIHIKPSIKPLSVSSKVSIRINDRGFLCFQYMIKIDDNNFSFVEYYCTPVVDVDEDNERSFISKQINSIRNDTKEAIK